MRENALKRGKNQREYTKDEKEKRYYPNGEKEKERMKSKWKTSL